MEKKISINELVFRYQNTNSVGERDKFFNKVYKKFAHFINSKAKFCEFKYRLPREEAKSVLMETLWKCMIKYDFKSSSFVNFYKSSIDNNLKYNIKKQIRYNENVSLYVSSSLENFSEEDDALQMIEPKRPDDLYLYECELLLKALKKDDHKHLLYKRYFMGLTFDEIAKMDGENHRQAVQQKHERVLNKIRERLEPQE